jgi:hypothetical protein
MWPLRPDGPPECAQSGSSRLVQPCRAAHNSVTRVSISNATLPAVVTPLMSRVRHCTTRPGARCATCNGSCPLRPVAASSPACSSGNGATAETAGHRGIFRASTSIRWTSWKLRSGHAVMMNFSTIPQWMFLTPHTLFYPSDPERTSWSYTQGIDRHDPILGELARYYSRVISWHTQDGFRDEDGKFH